MPAGASRKESGSGAEEPSFDAVASALSRGSVDSLPAGELERKLAAAAAESRQLRVKLGIDPTAPNIHLGHAVVLRKLRAFQDRGHRVILIVGDSTAAVGDPSGRSALRPILSEQEIERNAATFADQALRILDSSAHSLEVRRNSEWLDMAMSDLLRLLRSTTIAQLLEREDFAQRWKARKPISVLELIYPLLQGYDSVAVEADVELGGTDQKFNLLLGRDIQRAYGKPEQAVMTMPILVGVDGSRKMSKSLGNEIGVSDPPSEMFGKTMAIPDAAMAQYAELLLDEALPADRSARDSKRSLARALVSWLHDPESAAAAEDAFERQFVRHEAPEAVDEHGFCADEAGMTHVPGVIAGAFGVSRSEARRLLAQGGVQLDGARLGADETDVPASRLDGALLQIGKRKFRRLCLKASGA